MKKFLSLVLALVMTMSLVVVGASASDKFSDASSIQYPEAVDVVAACKIIDGYADGSFKAGDTLTRGAAAKIICNMILGPTTASALGADVAPFPDVAVNHTFAGYIAYCAQQGIINGYADGNFYPAKTVTGYQFMKMLLGALGYDGKVEGYTGGNWSVNVAKTALGIGLDDGNDGFVGTAAMTREEACLYAFNTIKADMVEYDTNLVVDNGSLGTSSKAKKLTYDNAGIAKKYDGQIDGEDAGDGIVQFGEKYFKDLKLVINNDNSDDFGRPATEWKYKSNSVGTYADSDKLLKTYTKSVDKGDLYTLVGKTVVDDLKDGTSHLTVYVNGVTTGVSPTLSDYMIKDSTSSAANTGKGVITEVYLNDDTNDVVIVVIDTYLMQADSDYSSSKETLTVSFVDNGADDPGLPTSISMDDFDVSGIKEDDYVLVTYSEKADEVKTVAKASTVTGEVTTYTTKDSVTVGGTKYKYNALMDTDNKNKDFSIGEDATLVMDAYGYIIYVDEATVASSNYVFVKEAAKDGVLSSAAVKADAYFADGTNSDITLYKVNDTKAKDMDDSDAEALSGWFTYTVNSDGKYTLKDPASPYTGSDAFDYTNAAVTTNGKVSFLSGKSVKGNSETVFLTLNSDDDVNVYTGVANVPTITASSGKYVYVTYVLKDTGYAKYVFIDMKSDADATVTDDTATTSEYTLVLKSGTKKINVDSDTYYYEYEALVNGEIKTGLKMDEKGALDAGVLYSKIKTNSDGYTTDASTAVSAAFDTAKYEGVQTVTDAVVSQSSGTVTFTAEEGTDSFVLSSDAKVYLVVGPDAGAIMKDEGADYETYLNISAKSLASTLKGYAFTGAVYGVKTDNTSTCETLNTLYVFVESTSELTVAAPTFAAITYGDAYTVSANKTMAAAGNTVTVTVAAAKGTVAAKTVTVAVKDASNNTVAVTLPSDATLTTTADTADSVKATFTMPAADVASIVVTLA